MALNLKDIKDSYLSDKNILDQSFYNRDTSIVARELIGMILVKIHPGSHRNQILRGIISETEAYYGIDDPASHASAGKTPRSEIMFGRAGMSYVYLCYGMYYLLNAVTEEIEIPGAVLIRAVWPLEGIEAMQERRKHSSKTGPCNDAKAYGGTADKNKNKKGKTGGCMALPLKHLADGPGKLTVAFGIDISDNKKDLTCLSSDLRIYNSCLKSSDIKITVSPRVGVSVAKERFLRFQSRDIFT